MKISSR